MYSEIHYTFGAVMLFTKQQEVQPACTIAH